MPKILIVDDDDKTRKVVKAHLSGTYEVIETASPETALVLAVEQEPDIILLDVSMPALSGFELCQTLSSLSFTQHIPIFIISGGDEQDKAFCQNLGAYRYFGKPIDFSELKIALASDVRSNPVQRRRDVRVQLKLDLTLRGKRSDGTNFEVSAATENVSKSGFLCACPDILEDHAAVEVCFGAREHRLGNARLVRVIKEDISAPRYGFQFTGLWESPLGATA
jgi:putative two-component system response regulator